MDFTPSEERRLLGDSLTRLLSEACSPEARNAVAYEAPFHSPALWDSLAELGLFYAFVPETAGGMGDGAGGAGFDIVAAFEPLGRALSPEPVLGQLMGLRLLAAAGAPLEDALSGQDLLALAVFEPEAPYHPADQTTQATATGDKYVLQGRKSVVYGAPSATRLLVSAWLDGALALFDVAAEAAERVDYAMVDGGGAAEVMLQDTPARILLRDAGPALEAALDAGRLALSAEAVGVAASMLETTIDYLKTRRQFGKPLAAFQALQHRAVDLTIELEQMRSINIRAAADLEGPKGPRSVAMAKNLVGRAGRLISEEAIQLHGGIAMTWEYPLSHYAKRLVMIDAQLGDADWQLDRLADMAMPKR
ncbi:MAG: acyl-CoA dehydrogenase [Pseudomonadota bacterium]